MNEQHTNLMYSAMSASALIGSSFFLPYLSSVANAQSPMDLMSMMNGNETGMSKNMSMPQLNFGIVTMPVMCTSLEEILGSFARMTGLAANATTGGSGGGNETQAIMDMMQQMMMSSGGALGGMNNNNMTAADMQEIHNMTKGVDLQQIMNMQLCSLMTDEKMTEEMLMNK